VICWRSTSSTAQAELQSPIRSYCVDGANGGQRVIALAKSLIVQTIADPDGDRIQGVRSESRNDIALSCTTSGSPNEPQ
jgi:hypothetical protein